jgi:uncharacterized delta-60 repeat protein
MPSSRAIRLSLATTTLALVLAASAWAALEAGGRYFGSDGAVLASRDGLHVGQAVLVDGRGRTVVAALDDSQSGEQRTVVTRLERAGKLDLGFSRGVSARLPLTQPEALAFDGSGGIYVGGSTARTEATSEGAALAVAHLHADGSLDRGFGASGLAGLATIGAEGSGRVLALRATGNGGVRVVGEAPDGSEPKTDLVIAQLTSQGRLDPRFGAGGVRRLPAAGLARLGGVAFTPTGRILVAGDVLGEVPEHPGFPHPRLARFLPNGSPDTSYGRGGVAAPTGLDRRGARVTDLALDRSGHALVTLARRRVSREFVVTRLTPGGTLDRGFASGGVLATGLREKTASAEAVSVDSRGRIVVVGTVQRRQRFTFKLFAALRLLPSGAPDRGFGHRGFNNLLIGNGTSAGWAVAPYGRRGAVAVGEGGGEPGGKTELAVVRYP